MCSIVSDMAWQMAITEINIIYINTSYLPPCVHKDTENKLEANLHNLLSKTKAQCKKMSIE